MLVYFGVWSLWKYQRGSVGQKVLYKNQGRGEKKRVVEKYEQDGRKMKKEKEMKKEKGGEKRGEKNKLAISEVKYV